MGIALENETEDARIRVPDANKRRRTSCASRSVFCSFSSKKNWGKRRGAPLAFSALLQALELLVPRRPVLSERTEQFTTDTHTDAHSTVRNKTHPTWQRERKDFETQTRARAFPFFPSFPFRLWCAVFYFIWFFWPLCPSGRHRRWFREWHLKGISGRAARWVY